MCAAWVRSSVVETAAERPATEQHDHPLAVSIVEMKKPMTPPPQTDNVLVVSRPNWRCDVYMLLIRNVDAPDWVTIGATRLRMT